MFRKEKVFNPQGFDCVFLLFVFSSPFSRVRALVPILMRSRIWILKFFNNFLIKKCNYFKRNIILLLNFLQILFLYYICYCIICKFCYCSKRIFTPKFFFFWSQNLFDAKTMLIKTVLIRIYLLTHPQRFEDISHLLTLGF